ncbi:MAG: hypothetical protein PHY93_08510 [Bacteriovorax sp.]|nr:hypothetical protein [Bacteriovorax sp.]
MDNLNKKFKEKIYILESFSPTGEKEFLKEAQDLMIFLINEKIEYEFFKFTSEEDLRGVLAKAGNDLYKEQELKKLQYLPYLHFICHGSEDGIVATNQTGRQNLITWKILNDILFGFSYNADKFGKEPLSTVLKRDLNLNKLDEYGEESKKIFDGMFKSFTYCLTYLVLTSCKGGALGAKGCESIVNFSFIIGSQNITYSNETSSAFQEFYKSFNEDKTFFETLYCMNDFIKEGSIEIFISPEMKNAFELINNKKNP